MGQDRMRRDGRHVMGRTREERSGRKVEKRE